MGAELRFRAMGTDATVVCVGGDELELVARAQARVDDLERRWSRFRADSEVNLINDADGRPVEVSTVTVELVAAAIEAWRWTGGRFDPTVRADLERWGYDRSFEQLGGDHPSPGDRSGPDAPAVGLADHGGAGTELGLWVDEDTGTVSVDPGRGLDLGGIGKGRAADLVVEDLLHAGAAGVCVDLGGDVRVAGTAPTAPAGEGPGGPEDAIQGGGVWVVGVADPAHDNDVATLAVALGAGAVATSTRRRRRWVWRGREAHHLIDPATRRPAAGDLDTVTVIGAEATWAEVVAKAALIAGRAGGAELVEAAGLAALLRGSDGTVTRVGGFDSFEVPLVSAPVLAHPAGGGRLR